MITIYLFLLITTILPIGFVADLSGFLSVRLLRKSTGHNLIYRNLYVGFLVGGILAAIMSALIPVIETGVYVSGIIGGVFGVYGGWVASGKSSLYFWKVRK